jgi:hypothetical protein
VLRKTVCLKQLGDDRGDEPGAGRFFANEKVTSDKIAESWSERTVSAVAGRHVLAVQDTSEIKYATKAHRRRGLGQCGHGNAYGVLVHAMLACLRRPTFACLPPPKRLRAGRPKQASRRQERLRAGRLWTRTAGPVWA